MTVVVTVNVSGRVRGFLASCMLQVAPGVYTAPRMSAGVRQRVESVLRSWFGSEGEGASILMVWADGGLAAGQGLLTLGNPPYELVEYDGLVLSTLRR
ncbi:MAG: type I-E CRISPR-associated endoribonuclease Cas2e [Desulfovibrionaceae bacterium]